ncbi:MAG: AbrB/MazE/SpoVT family DNA-binding domain-containing protein [Candidatus Brocadiia bacterium]
MKLTIQKWGSSAVVRLPRPLLQQIQCSIGDSLELEVVGGGLFLRPVREPGLSLDAILESCTAENVLLLEEDREWLQGTSRGKEL